MKMNDIFEQVEKNIDNLVVNQADLRQRQKRNLTLQEREN